MEILVGMVKQLLVLAVLALFLELLLPGGALRGYVQVVVGLLFVVVLLSSAGDALRRDWGTALPALASARGDRQEGTAGQNGLEQYRAGLAGQILGLARLHGGLSVADVEVELEEDGARWGRIREIRLVVDPGAGATGPAGGPVREVTVSPTREGPPAGVDEFARVVAGFYHLAPEQVRVTVR
ncbi:MAG: stage III sporulation protein AF [Desulfotomaculales bacterium]